MPDLRHRLRGAAVLVLVALAAAGCNTIGSTAYLREPLGHTTMPLDHEARHPIMLARQTETASLDVGVHGTGLYGTQGSEVVAFARSFRADGEGSLAVSVPSGSRNERAAVAAARDVRRILTEQGVPAGAIAYRPYRPENGTLSPPVLLTYTRLRAAVPHRCAVSGDMDQGPAREPWHNMGCAQQTNLAAMVANPADLRGPRPLDGPFATRRNTVLDRYGQGQDPSTNYRNETAGTVSRVAR
jgi:pilus assembly protein CpaD